MEKGLEGGALGTLTSMGMKQPKTNQERKSARITKKTRVNMAVCLSFMNSESGFHVGVSGSQIEGIEEIREKEGKQQIRTTLPRS